MAYSKPEAYSELWYIQKSGTFRTRDIQNQNPGLFRTLGYSEPDGHSEPCQTSKIERFDERLIAIIIFASCNYFRNISFSCLLVHEIYMIF